MQDIGKRIGFWLGPLTFFLLYWGPSWGTMPTMAQATLAATLWVAIWWITEAIPLAATSLLPLVLLPLTGVLSASQTASAYGDSAVFLYLGGFILALGMEAWGLHRRIALGIISTIGGNYRTLVLGFMIATAFLSMWISNTATTLLMLPIAMGVIAHLHGSLSVNMKLLPKALLLGIAYSASIGGIATPIGSPTNAILLGAARTLLQIDITFTDWVIVGMPISVLLLFIAWWLLVKWVYPMQNLKNREMEHTIEEEKAALGPVSKEEKRVMAVFAVVAALWIFRGPLVEMGWQALNDTAIGIMGALALFLIPAGAKGEKLLRWEATQKLPWGVLLLFGGGFAIAQAFQVSGLAAHLAGSLEALNGLPMIAALLLIALLVNFLTEITSNVATATLMMPILVSLGLALGWPPLPLLYTACIAASCAFMLPVATPPNAIVFGSGQVRVGDMVRAGFWLNIISTLLIAGMVYVIHFIQ